MKSKILLQKLNSYHTNHIESFVRESVNLLENKRQLFIPSNKILLKPNLLRGFEPGRCVTTHPALIETVCRVLKDLGIKNIECIGGLSIDAFKVSDFKLAKFPVDITFNPFRLAKSLLKQFYEVGIRERLAKES